MIGKIHKHVLNKLSFLNYTHQTIFYFFKRLVNLMTWIKCASCKKICIQNVQRGGLNDFPF